MAVRTRGEKNSLVTVAACVTCSSRKKVIPTPRKLARSADQAELRAAADRLAAVPSGTDDEEMVAEFKQMRRRGKGAAR